jgi:serine/threonine protein phosphatase PrpC
MHPSVFPSHLSFGALDVAAASQRGAGRRLREENQDNVLLIDCNGNAQFLRDQQPVARRVPGWRTGHARIAVLDGMGGHGHGREAAEAAVAGLFAIPPCDDAAELAHHLDLLHAELQRHFAGAAGPRPGTTLTMLELPEGALPLLYHVGDSRLYEVWAGGIAPLTVDHVPATAWAMSGMLSEAEWWQQVHAEHRPQLAQAFILGNAFSDPTHLNDPLFELSAANLPPWVTHLGDRRAIALRPGMSYLLATDGLWSCADPLGWFAQWPQLLTGQGDAASMLGDLLDAYDANPDTFFFPDNVSAVLLRVPPSPGGREETALPTA